MNLDKKSIFLLDGVGAVVSFICLGIVLPILQEWFGMPKQVLYFLAGLALTFAIYSLTRWRFANHDDPKWLRILIGLNLSYCGISLFFLVKYASVITTLGFAYFIGEKLIVIGIAFLEWRVLQQVLAQR